jgi:hypothetical protein
MRADLKKLEEMDAEVVNIPINESITREITELLRRKRAKNFGKSPSNNGNILNNRNIRS